MDKFLVVFSIAIVIETITEYVKKAFPKIADSTGLIFLITAVLGIASAVAFNADIFSALGFASTIPFFGHIITGLVCAGGSNIVYDIVNRITNKQSLIDISDLLDEDDGDDDIKG